MDDKKLSFRKALSTESEEIAELHIENINAGFLTKLGKELLTGIYEFIISGNESFCLVCICEGKVVGFLSATEDTSLLYKRFFKKYYLWGSKLVLLKLLDPSTLRKIIDHLFLPRRRVKLPSAEFLTMAVKSDVKRNGIATKLFQMMQKEFKKRKVDGFIAVVGKSLIPSNKFMYKMKAKKISEFEVHRGEKSNVYFWD